MAALKIFKKDKREIKPEATAQPAAQPKAAVESTGDQIVRPHITEKATDLGAKNQYVFVVAPGAAKNEIARSVEKAYGVKVEEVRVVNVKAKKMRLGRTKGIKKGYKKAIVQVKKGQSIEILPT
ncbi:MAG TPA: 50S ribosomal protein L23 [Candidatus Paceibacterota bacterium]|nr:50S ribosomal protein L23 [Candidatus Paceibacterota bacterium]